jgi:hypothetical protein
VAFLLAILATPVLLVVAAMASPEWPERDQVMAALQSKASFDTPQGRLIFSLIPFGIFLGIPAALGLVEPSNVLAVLGALVACMLGHSFLGERPPPTPFNTGQFNASHGWFVAISWAVLALPVYAGSFSLSDSLALQAVLGPAPLTAGVAAAGLWVALLAGTVAAAGWASGLPKLAGLYSPAGNKAADYVARWGETALAGTAVSAVIFGPSVGALAVGPVDGTTFYRVAISFLVSCGVVAGASYSRRFLDEVPPMAAATTAGMLTGIGMMIAAFVK